MSTNNTDILKTLLPGLSTKYSGNLYTANLPTAPIEDIDPGPDPTPTPTTEREIQWLTVPYDSFANVYITLAGSSRYMIPYSHIELDTNPKLDQDHNVTVTVQYGSTVLSTLNIQGGTCGIVYVDVTAFKKELEGSDPIYYVRINGYTKVQGGVSYNSLFTKCVKVNNIHELDEFLIFVGNNNHNASTSLLVTADKYETIFE